MRTRRLLAPEGVEGVYHVVSRVVDRRMVLGEKEKRRFMKLALGYADFSGVDLISWCVMSNHFHLLVRVRREDKEALGEKEILRRLRAIYSDRQVGEVREVLGRIGTEAGRREYLGRYTGRMGDLGMFMKTLKQRFSQWFNREHERRGTLWEDRYKSTRVEGVVSGEERGEGLGLAARIVAGYIDLNPVRAGMVEDPKDYVWSSYGAGLRGNAAAVAGMEALWGRGKGVRGVLSAHRLFLYEEGSEERVPAEGEKAKRYGIEVGRVWAERRRGGRLPLGAMLRLRVRHLTDGAVVGSGEFVGRVMGRRADGSVREGVPMRFGEWGGLHAARNLRVDVVGVAGERRGGMR